MLSTRWSVPFLVALCAIGVLTVRSAAAAPALAGSRVQRGYTADGRLNFIGSASDPFDLPPGTAASLLPGRGNAGAFISLYGPAFGLRDPGSQVALNREDTWADGRATNRYRQVHQGVPVLGGDLVVNTDARGRLVAMAGKVSPDLDVDTTPGVTAGDATATAQAALTAAYGAGFTGVVTEAPALWIYDESLLTESEAAPSLVWKMEISGLPTHPVREVVLVDAQTGQVALHFNRIDTRWGAGRGTAQLQTFAAPPIQFTALPSKNYVESAGFAPLDIYGNPPTLEWGTDTTPVCDHTNYSTNCNNLAPTDPDATLAFLYSANTWEFFNATHAYDFVASVTGGAGIMSLINIGGHRDESGWYKNAYWDGERMNYGDGFAEAEDVVAHEMTHGVTESTSGLLYLYQSGAINESLSDLWGEFVDQSYTDSFGSELDAPANKWYLGEDLPGIGAIRSMANPPLYRDPDKMTSSYYYRGPLDNGGVHTNSGINNKAAYLMANGGTFNGYTVTALGIEKAAKIYFKVQNEYLFPGADYSDLYNALNGACAALYPPTSTNPYVPSAECLAVARATKAVQMDKRPAAISTGVVAECPTGTVYGKEVFFDDFESATIFTNNWRLTAEDDTRSPIPASWERVYYGFSDAKTNNDLVALYAGGLTGMGYYGQEFAAMVDSVPIEVGQKTHFSFEHTYLFENWGAEKYDGGVVEYSTDGGGTWTDLRTRFSAGQNYNGVVFTGYGNPLSGRPAFVANSRGGRVFTRYDLTPLAGQDVKIRFRIGYDYYFDWGWFIDRVDIHTCVPAPAKPVLLAPASGALVYDYTPTLQWADALRADSYEVQIFSDAKMLTTVEAQTGLLVSEFTPAELDANVRYYWRVRSVANNDKPGYSAWTALRSFRTALTTPERIAPTAGADTRTDRPTFSWNPSVGASSYLWQVCRNGTCTQIVTQGTVNATQATPSVDLPVNATLYWRVLANGTNKSAWADPPWSFTTGNPPTIPVLLAPAANLLTFDTTPTFTWKPSLLAAGTSGPLSYNIQLATDALFTNVVAHLDNTALTEMTMDAGSPLSNAWTCYWRVQSVNGSGGTAETSGWSTPRALRIGYATPTLLAPANAGPTGSKTVVFDWDVTGQNNPTNYTIQFSVNDTFSPLLASGTAVPSTYTRTFTQTGTLYWRVRANGSYGPSAWSAPFSFVLP